MPLPQVDDTAGWQAFLDQPTWQGTSYEDRCRALVEQRAYLEEQLSAFQREVITEQAFKNVRERIEKRENLLAKNIHKRIRWVTRAYISENHENKGKDIVEELAQTLSEQLCDPAKALRHGLLFDFETTIKRRAIDMTRPEQKRRKRTVSLTQADGSERDDTPSLKQGHADQLRDLQKLYEAITDPRNRELFIRRLQEFEVAEIAKEMNVSTRDIGRRLTEVRQHVREMLGLRDKS